MHIISKLYTMMAVTVILLGSAAVLVDTAVAEPEDGPVAEREEVLSFLAQVGLPRSLEQLGISPCGESGLRRAAEEACSAGSPIHNMPFPVSPQAVYRALLAADGEGRRHS